MISPRNVYLTGFMGSGKSTIGPALARQLGVPFVDLDRLIVQRAGVSIPEIFAEGGEDHFRAVERETLMHTAMQDPSVVALGGGTLARAENLQFARQAGIVVYLKATVDVLTRRLERGRNTRPMLQDSEGNRLRGPALRDRVNSLMLERRGLYEQAQITIDTSGKPVSRLVEEIVHAIALESES